MNVVPLIWVERSVSSCLSLDSAIPLVEILEVAQRLGLIYCLHY